jgi:hypothetical protein
MTKHRSVVTGWDPAKVNPDGSTGRPKGVQTAADMRIHSTFDVLGAGIFAHKGIPAITGSPTNSATISTFMAAVAAAAGGFYVFSIDAAETFTINMANIGAVKIYAQQQDYQVDSTHVDSNVVIGVVYGANPIPYNSILLFSTTITNQTSTSGLTFVPEFKFTGAASGAIRVPLQADLPNITSITNGTRGLVLGGAGAGEWVYNAATTSWLAVSPSNNLQAAYPVGSIYMNATANTNPNTLFGFGTWVAFGAGRMPVGFDSTQTEFNTIGKTGGTKTETLTTAQIPSHNHTLGGDVNNAAPNMSASEASLGPAMAYSKALTTSGTGGGGSHNNLPPYVTVYMWQRTA